jgi:hypothetical protein
VVNIRWDDTQENQTQGVNAVSQLPGSGKKHWGWYKVLIAVASMILYALTVLFCVAYRFGCILSKFKLQTVVVLFLVLTTFFGFKFASARPTSSPKQDVNTQDTFPTRQ